MFYLMKGCLLDPVFYVNAEIPVLGGDQTLPEAYTVGESPKCFLNALLKE